MYTDEIQQLKSQITDIATQHDELARRIHQLKVS
jgi:hypothetical protein